MPLVDVAIPSIGHSDLLLPLIDACLASPRVDSVIVYENRRSALGQIAPTGDPLAREVRSPERPIGLRYRAMYGTGLYGVWNEAVLTASHGAHRHLVILNDDVTMHDDAIAKVIDAMEQNPEYVMVGFDYFADGAEWPPGQPFVPGLREVKGTFRHHGIGGFAFAVDVTRCPTIDERLTWWGGDDDLVNQITANGDKVGVMHGARVEHPAPETSAVHYPHLLAAKDRDREIILAKWGAAW